MYETWKDFLALCYETVEKMEEKSTEYGGTTKQKVEAMKEQLKGRTAKTRKHMDERLIEMKSERSGRMQDLIKETGLASQEELSEIRDMVADLNQKIDVLTQKKEGKKE